MTRISSLILVTKIRPVGPKKLFGTSRFAGPEKRSKRPSFLNISEICLPCETQSEASFTGACSAKQNPCPRNISARTIFQCGGAFHVIGSLDLSNPKDPVNLV